MDLYVKFKCKLKAIFCLLSHWCHCDLVVSGFSVSGLQQVMDLMEGLVITLQFFIATAALLKINYASVRTLGDYLWLLCGA